MTKEQLIEIRKKADEAASIVNAMGCINTWNLSIEERIDLDANYRIKQDIWWKLESDYRKAFDQYIKNKVNDERE